MWSQICLYTVTKFAIWNTRLQSLRSPGQKSAIPWAPKVGLFCPEIWHSNRVAKIRHDNSLWCQFGDKIRGKRDFGCISFQLIWLWGRSGSNLFENTGLTCKIPLSKCTALYLAYFEDDCYEYKSSLIDTIEQSGRVKIRGCIKRTTAPTRDTVVPAASEEVPSDRTKRQLSQIFVIVRLKLTCLISYAAHVFDGRNWYCLVS